MQISTISRNTLVDAFTALLNVGGAGTFKIYDGTIPTNTTDADAGTLLATMTFSATSFAASASGTATANSITSDTNVDASGSADYYRLKNNAGTCIAQGAVATSGAEVTLNTTTFVAGGTCACSAATITCPAS